MDRTKVTEPLHQGFDSRKVSEDDARSFFAVRSGSFENAVEACRPVVLENIDGQLRGAWLLTEIDHWDHEKERLVLLTDKSILAIKFDFITMRILDYQRTLLADFDRIIIGEITYPEKSLMPTRHLRGVRAMWNKGQEIHFTKNWNPWSRDIPFVTYTSHHLYNNITTRETRDYDVDLFGKSLTQAVKALNQDNENRCTIEEGNIVVQNYVGIVSGLHNAIDLGFFKARGRVSF